MEALERGLRSVPAGDGATREVGWWEVSPANSAGDKDPSTDVSVVAISVRVQRASRKACVRTGGRLREGSGEAVAGSVSDWTICIGELRGDLAGPFMSLRLCLAACVVGLALLQARSSLRVLLHWHLPILRRSASLEPPRINLKQLVSQLMSSLEVFLNVWRLSLIGPFRQWNLPYLWQF